MFIKKHFILKIELSSCHTVHTFFVEHPVYLLQICLGMKILVLILTSDINETIKNTT